MSRFVPTGPGWRSAGGVLYHVPHYAASRSREPHIKPLYFQVPYLGGSVIAAPKFYFTFWGYKKAGDPNKVEPLLKEYAKSMGGSAHNNIETQYYEGATGTQTYITNPAKQYGGAWNDDAAIPKTPTDPEIAYRWGLVDESEGDIHNAFANFMAAEQTVDLVAFLGWDKE